MKKIGDVIHDKNLQLDSDNPVLRDGFTQVPNFVLRNSDLSVGAKVTYAMFLSYAWHNDSCFPGQDRLANDMGLTRVRVTQLIAELEKAGFRTQPPLPHRLAPNSVCRRFRSAEQLFWKPAHFLCRGFHHQRGFSGEAGNGG